MKTMHTNGTDAFADIAFHQSQMSLVCTKLAEAMQGKGTVFGLKRMGLNLFDRLLIGNPVVNQIGNRPYFKTMLFGKYLKVITARHCAIVFNDLNDNGCWLQPC